MALKKLGGEVRARQPRKRLFLSPARCVLAASSFASLLVAVAVYVAAIPGFTPPSTYRLPQADGGRDTTFAAVDIAKGLAGSGQPAGQSDELLADGQADAGDSSSVGLFALVAGTAKTTVQEAASQTQPRDASAASGDQGTSAPDGQGASSSQQGGESSSASGDSASGSELGSNSAGSNAASSSLSSAEEAEFHSFLVSQFNALGNAIADQGELAGQLETCANTGYYGGASAGYSSAVSCDGTIDSVKASLNGQVGVAEKSRYYRAWEELELCCNDLGSGSVSLLRGWSLAASNSTGFSAEMLSYASQARNCANSAYGHQSSARGLL